MSTTRTCAECGAPVPTGVTQGLCPKCLLTLGLQTGLDDVTPVVPVGRTLVDPATPEALFVRQWALTVLDRVLNRLKAEYCSAGKQELFARLQNSLPGVDKRVNYAETSAALRLDEPAVRMAVHRLRHRYGELLRAEIAATVGSPKEIDEEIRHLIAAFGQS